jgi:hypothetical protein
MVISDHKNKKKSKIIKKPEFNPRIVHVGFMVHRVLLEQVFLQALGSFYMPIIIPLVLRILL